MGLPAPTQSERSVHSGVSPTGTRPWSSMHRTNIMTLCRSTTAAFGWEKPLNTHTCRRTSLVWAGCVRQQALALVEMGSPLLDLCMIALFNTTADEMGLQVCIVALAFGFGLCLSHWQEARHANRSTPQAPLASAGAIAPQVSTLHTASLCSANSDPAGARPQGMLCLDAQQMSPAFEGWGCTDDNLTGWSVHCLVASLFTHHTPGRCGRMGLRGQEPPTTLPCLVWGMPGRPGPGFRLRCVQSVSFTW